MPIRRDHRLQLLRLSGGKSRLPDCRRTAAGHGVHQVLHLRGEQGMSVGRLERLVLVRRIGIPVLHIDGL